MASTCQPSTRRTRQGFLTSVMFIGANNGAAASNGAIQEYSLVLRYWGTDASETSLATFSDVGAVYGNAYQNTSNTVFASSFSVAIQDLARQIARA